MKMMMEQWMMLMIIAATQMMMRTTDLSVMLHSYIVGNCDVQYVDQKP